MRELYIFKGTVQGRYSIETLSFFRIDKSNEWGKEGKEKNDSGNRTRDAPLTCQTFNHCATTANEVTGLKANEVSHLCGKVRERCSSSIFAILPTFYCSLWTVVIVKLRNSLGRSFPQKKVIKIAILYSQEVQYKNFFIHKLFTKSTHHKL